MGSVVLSRRAVRDLRRLGRGEVLSAIQRALEALASSERNLDIKALAGADPWRRLRVGDHRVVFRLVDPAEGRDPAVRILVARVVHRRDLERAVATLS